MSFKKQFLRNLFISGGYTYLSQVINFIASFFTSRILKPQDFGLVGLITVFSGFINIFSDSGLTLAIIRSDYKYTYYRGLNAVSILIGCTLCTLMLIIIYPVSLFYNNSQLILPGICISLLFIIRSFFIVPMAVLQKNLHFSQVGKIVLISTSCATCSTILLALCGFGYWSLIWSQFINAAVNLLLVRAEAAKIFSKVKKSVFVKSLQLAQSVIGSLTGFNIVNYWSRNADNLLVGKFYGTNDLGIYSRSYLMLQLPLNLITGLFTSVFFPSLVKYKKAGGNVEKEYYFMLKLISLINLPVAFILIIFPQQFVLLLWGKNWLQVAGLLPYFGLMVMLQTLFSTVGSMLVLEKKEKALMFSGWVSAVFILAGIFLGITISLTAVAAFYALSIILLVAPFIIFYSIKNKLHFSKLLSFWIPKILLCLLLWFAIYYHSVYAVWILMAVWTIIILISAKEEIFKGFQLLNRKRYAFVIKNKL